MAIVTGAARGIGAAIAERFAKSGWDLTISSRGREALEQRAGELAELPSLLAEKAKAPSVVAGPTDLVIDPTNLWLTIHESIGHATELDRALATRPDYVALGPVWPTILKAMKWAPQGLDRVADWKRRVGTVPLVAIGGLTPERGRAALEAGADVVSAVTDITLSPDPEGRMRAWLAATEATGASRPRTPAGYFCKEEWGGVGKGPAAFSGC